MRESPPLDTHPFDGHLDAVPGRSVGAGLLRGDDPGKLHTSRWHAGRANSPSSRFQAPQRVGEGTHLGGLGLEAPSFTCLPDLLLQTPRHLT